MIRICHVTSVHPVFDTRIFHKECKSLAKMYEVYLIAPNVKDDLVDGIHIAGVSLPHSRRKRIRQLDKVFAKMIEIDATIYHFHDPELLPLGLKIKKKGKKIVFDSHEDVPQQLSEKKWIPKVIREPLSWLYASYEKRILTYYNAVISVTPSIVNRLRQINPETYMVTNYPDYQEFSDNRKFGKSVCFAGGISPQWMHEFVLDAIEGSAYTYLLAGKAQEDYFKLLKEKDAWKNVDYKGMLPHEQVWSMMEQSSAGIALNDYMANVGYKMGSLGNTKLFEYMMFGLPVIATDFTLWKEIVEGYDCGICVNPHDVKAIRAAIDFFINHPDEARRKGDNGRKAVKEKYCWATQEPVLYKLYERVIERE